MKFAIENVGCLPWDFPVPLEWEEANLEICYAISTDSEQSNKVAMFYKAMNNNSNLRQCQCMPDCEATIYETQVSMCLINLSMCYLSSLHYTDSPCPPGSRKTLPRERENL